MFVYTLHTNVHAHAPFGRLVKRSDGENNRTAGSKPKCSMNPVNVDSIPIWVVAYPQEGLRQKIGGQRLRAQLPPVPDLQRLLQAAGVHGKLNANTEISTVHGAYLVGLARVRPGASGEFELQDDIMHSYFRAPGCSVVVEEFAALNISPPVRVNLCRFESQYPAVPWHRHKIGPFLSTDDWSSVMVEWQGQQVQAREVLRRWGRVADIESIRVVPVVENRVAFASQIVAAGLHSFALETSLQVTRRIMARCVASSSSGGTGLPEDVEIGYIQDGCRRLASIASTSLSPARIGR